MPNITSQFDFDSLKDRWPSAIVARCRAADFTGGLISSGTLANEDCKGTGPQGRFQIGNKIAYPVDSVIAWLKEKAGKTRVPVNPSARIPSRGVVANQNERSTQVTKIFPSGKRKTRAATRVPKN